MRPALLLAALTALTAAVLTTAAPAAAQYGGGPNLVVDPVRVPIDGTFDGFGSSCAARSTVTVTIDGIPGVLASTVAAADTFYVVLDVRMPAGVVAGADYVVRATCGGRSATFLITAVCNDGSDPVNGGCPDGTSTGGGPGVTTTTLPGGATTTTPGGGPGGGPGGSPGGGGPGGPDPILAITGAGPVEQMVTVGTTLVAAGFFLMMVTARHEPDEA